MTELQQSPEIVEMAKKLGVEIDSTVTFDPQTPILKVAAQFNGEGTTFGAEDAEFGGLFSKIFRKAGGKKIQSKVSASLAAKTSGTARDAALRLAKAPVKLNVKQTATGLAKVTGKAVAIASFVVPGAGPLIGGSALAAMKAADKLLGDPKIKNAAQLISNTKALAAMGNVPARRGAAVLGAVAQIRQVKAVAPGQAVIKVPTPPVNTKAFTQVTSQNEVKALATRAAATAPKKTFWQKIKDWFR